MSGDRWAGDDAAGAGEQRGANPFARPASDQTREYTAEQAGHGQQPAYGQQPGYGQPGYGPAGYGPPPAGGGPYGPGPYGPAPYGAVPYGMARPTNGMAIASLVLGVLWLYWVGSILALIFGYVARRQIRERGDQGHGLAVAGIVLGWIGVGVLVVGALIGVVAGISNA